MLSMRPAGIVALLGASCAVVVSCNEASRHTSEGVDASGVEALIALTFPAGSNLTAVGYTVLSATGDPIATGTINPSALDSALSVVLLLPPGTGEVLALTGTTTNGQSCAGTSAPFNLVEDQATNIDVTLICP